MKKFFFFFLVGQLTVLLSLAPSTVKCQQESLYMRYWYCCHCDKLFKKENLKPQEREKMGRRDDILCPDCQEKLGELEAALARLKGKNRGLYEAYKAHQRDYETAHRKLLAAYERTFGKEGWPTLTGLSGSLGTYYTAMASLLSNGMAAGKFSRIVAAGTDIASVYQSGKTPSIDMGMSWSGIVLDIFTDEWTQKWFQTESRRGTRWTFIYNVKKGMPIDVAKDLYKETRKDFYRDMKQYNNVGIGVNLIMDMWGFYQATKKIHEDAYDIDENYRDGNALLKQMKAIQDSIVKNVDLMTCIKNTIDYINKGGSTKRHELTGNSYLISFMVPVLFDKNRLELFFADAYDASIEVDEIRIMSAISRLKQLEVLQDRILSRIEFDIIPLLFPWLLKSQDELKPSVLFKMLRQLNASVSLLITDLKQAKPLAESIYEDLKNSITGYSEDYFSDSNNPEFFISSANDRNSGDDTRDKWALATNEKIKNGMSRINLSFPKDVDWSIDILTPENKNVTNRSSYSKHPGFYDINPGNYNFKLNAIPVENVTVEKGKEIMLKAGFLQIITREHWDLYNESKEKYYTSDNKPRKIALPVGRYTLNFEGKDYRVVIKDRVTVKFETPMPFLPD